MSEDETAAEPGTERSFLLEGRPSHPLDGSRKAMIRAALFSDAAPVRLGRFELRGPLGRGGMGKVLRAYDESLDREVALKLLHGELAERHGRRLLREAQALARLSHPNVVQVHEVGEVEGQTFIAMELIEGGTLADWQQEPHSWRECVEVYRQAGLGLAAAHEQGLVHRDFKPANCVIDRAGRVRVIDFGLARGVEGVADSDEREPRGESPLAAKLTRGGAIMGTVAYMAPEQLAGKEADAKSDQFGLCVALFEAVYGARPFEGDSVAALAISLGEGRVLGPPRGILVPARLRRILVRGLAVRPRDRWPSMEALVGELSRLIAPRRAQWIAMGIAVGSIGLGVGLASYAEVGRRCEGARAQLSGIWDDTRGREVEEAIMGTELSYARGTWERVEIALDEYAENWALRHAEVCEATRVTEVQTEEVMGLRMACLSGRRIALRNAVEVLTTADRTTVHNATSLVTELPSLARCDDVEALRVELPPPEDPRDAERVRALRDQLARVRVLRGAGRYRQSVEIVEEVMAEANALQFAPLQAEVLLERGLSRDASADFPGAEEDLRRAYVLAATLDHRQVELRAVSELAFVVGVSRERAEEGMHWGTTALALGGRAHAEPEDEARAHGNVAMVLRVSGQFDDAREHVERALSILEPRHGSNHPDVVTNLGNLAVILEEQGRLEEALELGRRVLSITEDVRVFAEHRKSAAVADMRPAVVVVELGAGDPAKITHTLQEGARPPLGRGRVGFALERMLGVRDEANLAVLVGVDGDELLASRFASQEARPGGESHDFAVPRPRVIVADGEGVACRRVVARDERGSLRDRGRCDERKGERARREEGQTVEGSGRGLHRQSGQCELARIG